MGDCVDQALATQVQRALFTLRLEGQANGGDATLSMPPLQGAGV